MIFINLLIPFMIYLYLETEFTHDIGLVFHSNYNSLKAVMRYVSFKITVVRFHHKRNLVLEQMLVLIKKLLQTMSSHSVIIHNVLDLKSSLIRNNSCNRISKTIQVISHT